MILVGNILGTNDDENFVKYFLYFEFIPFDRFCDNPLPTGWADASGSHQLNLLPFVIFQMKQNIWLYAVKLSKNSI